MCHIQISFFLIWWFAPSLGAGVLEWFRHSFARDPATMRATCVLLAGLATSDAFELAGSSSRLPQTRLRRPLMAQKKEKEESGGFALPTLPELPDLPFELPSLGAGEPCADTT